MTVTTLTSQFSQLDMNTDLPLTLLHSDENVTLILYKPRDPDKQQPHDQDEYYFVASGSAMVTVDGQTTSVTTGDAIFVPALAPHAFSQTSDDFACWGLFYGPRKSHA